MQEAYAEAEADLLRSKGKRRKKGKAGGGEDSDDEEDAFFKGLSLQGKLPKYVELLKFKVSLPPCQMLRQGACSHGSWAEPRLTPPPAPPAKAPRRRTSAWAPSFGARSLRSRPAS